MDTSLLVIGGVVLLALTLLFTARASSAAARASAAARTEALDAKIAATAAREANVKTAGTLDVIARRFDGKMDKMIAALEETAFRKGRDQGIEDERGQVAETGDRATAAGLAAATAELALATQATATATTELASATQATADAAARAVQSEDASPEVTPPPT